MVGFTVTGYTKTAIKYTCMANKFVSLDDDYKFMIDRYMCSSMCPCPEGAKDEWDDVSDSVLEKYTRVRTGDDVTEKQIMDGKTPVPLKFSADNSYETYKECYN